MKTLMKKMSFKSNFLVSKVRKCILTGKRRHQNFESKLSGCNKIIKIFQLKKKKKLLKQAKFDGNVFWGKVFTYCSPELILSIIVIN